MANTVIQQLALLRRLVHDLPYSQGVKSSRFIDWRRRTVIGLGTVFGDDSRAVKDFDSIQWEPNFLAMTESPAHAVMYQMTKEEYSRACHQAKALLEALITRLEHKEQEAMPKPTPPSPPTPNTDSKAKTNRVFIVHGHDAGLKNAVGRFIKTLGLADIILHEQPSRGATIIEKFEREAAAADFAVVLFTGDDLAESVKQLESSGTGTTIPKEALQARARQNVVFELGFFVSRLGRANVAIIAEPSVEIPSDFSGVVYIDRAHWQSELYSALGDAGFEFTQKQTRDALAIRT